ncbi:hypothetical protein FD38_GL001360 [Levilactobacillus zymae DSM 19395]|nr:hypothetical protein FD38_GL001360 [Levilactobacillus zymae DSM 19395]
MTDVGTAMIASANKAEKAIIFDNFLVTESMSTDTDLTKATMDLFANSLSYPINSKTSLDNTFTVKAVLANKTDKFTVNQDFTINAIGILAHIDGDSDSSLITVAVADGDGAVITAFKDTLYSLTVGVTQTYRASKPAKFELGNLAYALAIDLKNYYNKPEIDAKLKDLDGYATVKQVNDGDAATLASAKGYTNEQNAPQLLDGTTDVWQECNTNGTGFPFEAVKGQPYYISVYFKKPSTAGGVAIQLRTPTAAGMGGSEHLDTAQINTNLAKAAPNGELDTYLWTATESGTVHLRAAESTNGNSFMKLTVTNTSIYVPWERAMANRVPVDVSGYQQQSLFTKNDYKILAVPSGSDFRSYIMAHLPNPGIYYIRDDTQSGVLTDIMLISEGNGSYKMSGLDSQHRFKFRSFDSNTDTGWFVTATDNNGYGAENLIYNSSHLVSLDGWSTNGNGANSANISLGKHNFYHNGQDNLIVISTSNQYNGGSSGEIYTTSKKFAVTPGAMMFYSMICFASANVYGVDIYFLGYKADGTMVPVLIQSNAKLSPNNAEIRRGFFAVPNDCVTGSFRVDNNGSTDGKSSGVYFVEPQVKEQSIASPYTASPMDFFAYRDGTSREGADLDVDFAPGIHRSDSGVLHGFFGGNNNSYIVWETLLADNNAMIQKEYKNGVTATREYYLGSGWGPWHGTTVDNGNGTITYNGKTYTPLTKENDLQAIYNQVQTMILAEFTKRNAPSHWYTGLTQAQYNAITTKDTTAEYDINE